ncbi:MAG TPA: antibiotic biosynthesis monooxygenase family protein [Micromonosporaceae bacterium]|nr:antibiotic biosynthesis monooxygenase family protein [Micromonosporaceae bacterium]
MLVVLRFVVDDESAFLDEARQALTVLADRPGYRSGQLCRAYDEPTSWCLITEWESVGAYRRALGSYEVKATASPLLGRALPEASAFEPLVTARQGEPVVSVASDRGSGRFHDEPSASTDSIASRP